MLNKNIIGVSLAREHGPLGLPILAPDNSAVAERDRPDAKMRNYLCFMDS